VVAADGDTKTGQRDRNDGRREDLAAAGASPGIDVPEPSEGGALTRSEQGRLEEGDQTAERIIERGGINAGPASGAGSPAAGAVFVAELPSVYIGSKSSNKYHMPECRYAAKIQKENRVEFASSEEAKRQGYLPCKVCNP
jgi:hypothetical protein